MNEEEAEEEEAENKIRLEGSTMGFDGAGGRTEKASRGAGSPPLGYVRTHTRWWCWDSHEDHVAFFLGSLLGGMFVCTFLGIYWRGIGYVGLGGARQRRGEMGEQASG